MVPEEHLGERPIVKLTIPGGQGVGYLLHCKQTPRFSENDQGRNLAIEAWPLFCCCPKVEYEYFHAKETLYMSASFTADVPDFAEIHVF